MKSNILHLIRLLNIIRAKSFYKKIWFLNLFLQSIPSYLHLYSLLVKKTWGMCNSYIQTFYDEENLKKKPSKSISSMNFSLKVYLCTSERAPTRPAKLEAMVLNSICLSLACSPTWDREQSLFFSIFFVSIMKSFLNRPSDTGYRWKLNCRTQL